MNIILIGAPGSGKGTIAKHLINNLDLIHISTGDLLRKQAAKNLYIRDFLSLGKLLPDNFISHLIFTKLSTLSNNKGFILDGYPRTIDQVKTLNKMLDIFDLKIDIVLEITLATETIIDRILGRRHCPDCNLNYGLDTLNIDICFCPNCNCKLKTRDDDTKETILKRLEVYDSETKPLINYYAKQGLIKEYDNTVTDIDKILHLLK